MTKKGKTSVSSVAMSVAEPPSIINKRGKDYTFFGNDNLYPYYLVGLYESSPTHGAIINGKTKYITGRGLYSEDESTDIILQRANKNESWNQLFRKIALDYEIHNRYYIEVVRTRGGGKAFYHLDATRIRVDDENQIWSYSDDWKKNGYYNSRPTIVKFIQYDPNRVVGIKDEEGNEFREIIPYDEYRPNFESYAYPNYMNIITAIEAEAEISNYDLDQWKNGFLGNTVINFNNGEPENEAAKAIIEKTVKDTIGGSGGSKILINYADTKDNEATITGAKGENSAQEADMAANRISRTIFTGHTITSPTLLGVMNESAFSGNAETLEAYELFKETYVINRQKVLIDSVEYATGLDGIEVEELRPIQMDIPINEVAPYLKPNELRKLVLDKYGIEEIEEEVEPVEEVAFSGMSEEQDLVLKACKKYGRPKSNFIEVAGKSCEFDNGKLKFADLSKLDLWILSILDSNPNFSATEIAETAKENGFATSVIDVFERLGMLVALNWIAKNGAEYVLSRLGEREAKKEPLPEIELETVYSYELRPDAPELVPGGTSRPFCVKMVKDDKFYTKEEILEMDNQLGTNVWMTRGGWYTKAGTDISLPFCRHWWVQKIVKAK